QQRDAHADPPALLARALEQPQQRHHGRRAGNPQQQLVPLHAEGSVVATVVKGKPAEFAKTRRPRSKREENPNELLRETFASFAPPRTLLLFTATDFCYLGGPMIHENLERSIEDLSSRMIAIRDSL